MPAPTNTSAGAAIDVGTLPASITQDVFFAGVTYTVWYKVTAPVNSKVIGAWGFSPLADPYDVETTAYSDAGITAITTTGATGANKPIQFPVTPGNTYWLKFAPNAGNPNPANLQVKAEVGPNLAVPVGSIAVNDDTELFPLVLLSATADDTVLNFFDTGFAAGEAGDVLNSGISLWSNAWNDDLKLYDAQFNLITTLAIRVGFDIGIRTCNGQNLFYVAEFISGPPPVLIKTINSAGVVGGTSWSLTGHQSVQGMAAKNDGTILYFSKSTGIEPIKTWDLIGNVAGPDLVPLLATYNVGDILYLDDDTLIVTYFNFGADLLVKRYDTAGVTLNTYNLGLSSYPASTFPRLAYAIDNPNSFWVMSHVSPDVSKFRNVKVSDGSILTTRVHVEYETGVFQGTATATPRSRFGNSFSCPFIITRAAIAGLRTQYSGLYQLTGSGFQPNATLQPGSLSLSRHDTLVDNNGNNENLAVPLPSFKTSLIIGEE
jgi:hypothetical protein